MTVLSDTGTPRFFPTTPWMPRAKVSHASSLILMRNRVGNLSVRLAYQVAETTTDSPSLTEAWGSSLSTNNAFTSGSRLSEGALGSGEQWVRFGFQAWTSSGVARGEVTVTIATAC